MGQGAAGGGGHCSPKTAGQDQAEPATPAASDSPKQASGAVVNARCPIMGGKVADGLTRDYKGQKVGFCCGGCPSQWDKLTDAGKDAKLAAATDHH